MNRTWIATVGAVLVAQACASKPSTDPPPPVSEAPAAKPAALPALPSNPTVLDPAVREWQKGQTYVYAAKSTNVVAFGSAPNAFDFDLSGTLRLVAISVEGGQATLFVTIPDTKIVSRVPGSQRELDKAAKQVSGAYAFVDFSGGHVARMRIPRDLPPIAANTFRSLVAALQFERPVQGADEYEAQEYDATGEYLARYQRDPAREVWSKRKERYLGLLAARATTPGFAVHILPQIIRSSGEVSLSPRGYPQSVDLHDEFVVTGAQKPVQTRSTIALVATAAESTVAAPRDWDALLASTITVSPQEPYGASADSLDVARIGHFTFEKVVARLEARGPRPWDNSIRATGGAPTDPAVRAKDELSAGDDSHLFIALSAILRTQPKTVPLAVARIRAHSAAAPELIDALGSASSAESERALVDLSNSSSLDSMLRSRALAALSRTPRPTSAAVGDLEARLTGDPFDGAALLGLGTYSRRLRELGKQAESARIGALLLDRLSQARDQGERPLVTVLRAIANSGYTPALDAVAAYFGDGREQVRVAAVRALQSMQATNVDGILAARIQTDASAEVRSSALAAAKVRGPSDVLVHAIDAAATDADDPHVRYDAVRVMVQWMPKRPDIRQALEKVARDDPENRIRDAAKAAL